jgi:hypothetical protein
MFFKNFFGEESENNIFVKKFREKLEQKPFFDASLMLFWSRA